MTWRIQFFLLSILSLIILTYFPIEDELVVFLLCGFGVVTILRLSSYYRLRNAMKKDLEIIEVTPEEKNIHYWGQDKSLKSKGGEKPKSRSVGEE